MTIKNPKRPRHSERKLRYDTLLCPSLPLFQMCHHFLLSGKENSFSLLATSEGFNGSFFEKFIAPNRDIHPTILILTLFCVGIFTCAGVPLTDQALLLT
ncbi:hypothetical protein BCV71DRAFT_275508 [Rhizopus microsporus]|uniref:Uncharacterized protein n=1 Tax=Rhizopus microsporus TaxID=58291 RepID=A0A1X0RRV8_RHIZD|nr:hypothetical protein BCV71DRAFT_275508 [Rhizopus microsporus]